LLAMDSDRLPLRKRKDVLHGAVRAVPLRQSVEQPWGTWEDGTKAATEEGAVELIQVAALGTLSLGWVAGVVVAARQPHVQDASHSAWKPLLGRWRLQT